MFELIRDAIAAHQTIILHRHTNPDGDALGSQIGLKHLILANYPDKTVYMVGDGAGRYGFMEDSIMDEIPDSAYQGALAIVLDTSAKSLISDTRYTLAAQTARIDHHIFVEKIADIEATDDTFESCCGLVAQMAQECGWYYVTAVGDFFLYACEDSDAPELNTDPQVQALSLRYAKRQVFAPAGLLAYCLAHAGDRLCGAGLAELLLSGAIGRRAGQRGT